MSYKEFAGKLTDFIAACPSMFHSVHSIAAELEAKGFSALKEKDAWNLEPGKGYVYNSQQQFHYCVHDSGKSD